MKPVPIDEPVKLLTQVQDFSYFAEDQVLTAGQLNRLIQHLDFADRATRAWLIGSGIVCGLEHQRQGVTVTLQPGCALTTDGDLLPIPAPRTFTHSRKFNDQEAQYQPLATLAPFQELLTAEAAAGDNTAGALTNAKLKDTALVLYLESFTKPPEFCTGENCDNKGPIQHHNLRVLLVPREKLTPPPPGLPDIAEALPVVHATRPTLSSGIKKLEGNDGLQAAFTTAITATRKSLLAALTQPAKNKGFKAALAEAGFDEPPNWDAVLPGKGLNPASEIKGLLHIFEFYRDGCQAYEEWRQSLYCLRGQCAPAPASHPKHVLLGETGRTARCPTDPLRHAFRRAAALAGCPDEVERSRLLWRRLIELVKQFNPATATPEIRLTPSHGSQRPLGERALPFYYGPQFAAPWNVEARLRCAPDQPPAYHRDPHLAFRHDLCGYDFYRVEGHLGKRLDAVEQDLKALRARHNLAFQVLAVQIEDDPDRVVLGPIRFFDLETLFHQNRLDLKLRLNDIDGYADKIKTAVSEGRSRIPPEQKPDEAIQATGELKAKAATARTQLPGRIADFTPSKVTTFMTSYSSAVATGHKLNANTNALAQNVQLTPGDRLVQPEAPAHFGQLLDIWRKRRRKVAELSVFQKFVQNNPGLEHLGGVPAGGTLVLVYSASDTAAGRIVKADFALPYFSNFDLSSLEEEDPPLELEAPEKPPFIFEPRPWIVDYDWKVAPITTVTFDDKFTQFGKTFEANLSTQVTQSVTDQFKVFTNLGTLFTKPAPGAVTFPGEVALPGAAGLAADPVYGDYAVALNRNMTELQKLRDQKAKGVAPREVDEQIKTIEVHTADLIAKAGNDLGRKVSEQESAGRDIGANDRAMATTLKTASLNLESNEARTAAKNSFKTINTNFGESSFVKTNFAKFGNAL